MWLTFVKPMLLVSVSGRFAYRRSGTVRELGGQFPRQTHHELAGNIQEAGQLLP